MEDERGHDPCVSVVLPTHNRPGWLAEAVRSVLAGEFQDYEIVVSNNGDPAHTRQLAKVLLDPRIRWVEQDRSTNMLENFTAGLALARGRYVAVLHDDDRWAPRLLSALVPPLEANTDAVLSFADHHVVDSHGEIDSVLTDRYTREFGRADLGQGYHTPFHEFAARQSVAVTASVFRRDAVQPADLEPEVSTFYDIWLTYLLAKTGGTAYYQDERLMYYRIHQTSATSALDLSGHLTAIGCRHRMMADPRMQPYRAVLRKRLARDHLAAGAMLLRQASRERAWEHLTVATRLRPSWKSIGALAAARLAPRSLLGRL